MFLRNDAIALRPRVSTAAHTRRLNYTSSSSARQRRNRDATIRSSKRRCITHTGVINAGSPPKLLSTLVGATTASRISYGHSTVEQTPDIQRRHGGQRHIVICTNSVEFAPN